MEVLASRAVPPAPSTSGSEAGRLTCTGGPLSLSTPVSPEEATTVRWWSAAWPRAAWRRATWAGVNRCSPWLPLIETTAACWVMATWSSPVTAAVKFAALVIASAGTRTTSRLAPGAIVCTISVSSTSSVPAT